jgi:uncharacterized small protein (DUF1192 family)
MTLFAPFRPNQDPQEAGSDAARIAALQAEVDRLRHQLEMLQTGRKAEG